MPPRQKNHIWFTGPNKDTKKEPMPGRPDSDAFMEARSADLKRCERLALTCLRLPCGQHDLCIGCPDRIRHQPN